METKKETPEEIYNRVCNEFYTNEIGFSILTEEQININLAELYHQERMKALFPSDEEVEAELFNYEISTPENAFRGGAEWMRKKILGV
jgi:hypothetical protein